MVGGVVTSVAAGDPDGFRRRLDAVRERIAACTDRPEEVTIVAVTKGFDVSAVELAASAGLRDVGENYAEEMVAKATLAGACPVNWHYLGAIQRNKIPRLVAHVDCWQSVSRHVEGQAIARRSPGARVLVQVDTLDREDRGGCPVRDVPELVSRLADEDLDVAGLMTVGPPGPPELGRPGFAAVAYLADRLDLAVRSMGMSDDFEVAVQEGSTMVRLGRVLFGDRPSPAGPGRDGAAP